MYRGYVKVWRMIQDTSFYKKSKVVHLALHLLLEANHKPKKFIFNNEEMSLERGQVLTGLFKLKQATGISIQSLRTCLLILTKTQFLTIKTTNQFSIITILNYNKFQDLNEIPVTSDITNEQQTSNKPITTNKNDKNVKNEKEQISIPDFIDKELLQGFIDMRKQIKKPLTELAKNLLIKKLTEFEIGGYSANDALKASIENSWQGVFCPKEKKRELHWSETPEGRKICDEVANKPMPELWEAL